VARQVLAGRGGRSRPLLAEAPTAEEAEDPMRARLAFAVLVALAAGGFAAAVAASSVPDPAREPARLPAAEHPFAAELEPAPRIVLAPIARVHRVDGARLYGAYCAQCHGERGHADGPLAERLGVTVPDLTALAGEGGTLDRGALRAPLRTATCRTVKAIGSTCCSGAERSAA
jgi:mono/diheme cytochrome c family protein